MAKKARRGRRVRPNSNTTNAVSESRQATSESKSRPDAAEQFQREYAYVLKDLRHILLLAAVMFLVLIALNMILQ